MNAYMTATGRTAGRRRRARAAPRGWEELRPVAGPEGAPGGLMPHYYDLEYANRTEDVGFYQRLAFEAGNPVLELGCGTGRLAIPLARTGSRMVGLDIDQEMLALCRLKRDRLAGALKGRLDLVQADMRRFSLGCRFPLVFAAFNTFQTLVDLDERDACLANVREHLADGGRFVVDVFLPDPARLAAANGREVFEGAFYSAATDATVMKHRRVRADLSRQHIDVEFRYCSHDRTGRLREDRRRLRLAVIFPNEMRLILARNGFAVREVYGSYDMDPLERESDRLIVVAEKA